MVVSTKLFKSKSLLQKNELLLKKPKTERKRGVILKLTGTLVNKK
jgi:hypothetical protein